MAKNSNTYIDKNPNAYTDKNPMEKTFNAYPEVEEIRHDLESLKTNVVELTRHVQANGADKAMALTKKARKRLAELQVQGKEHLKNVEKHVHDEPAKSLAIAFAAGLVASILFGRRK